MTVKKLKEITQAKYKTLRKKGLLEAHFPEEEKILALEPSMEELKENIAKKRDQIITTKG